MYEFLDYQVRDVMSKAPTTVAPHATLAEAERLLEKTGFNGLPVVRDGGTLVGFVTSLDLLEAFRFVPESILPQYDDVMRRPVSSLMRHEPETVSSLMPLTRLLERMVATRNKSFPVVDPRNGETLVGIVAREDVMRALRKAHAGEKPV
jgi:CBS domain-containing protein